MKTPDIEFLLQGISRGNLPLLTGAYRYDENHVKYNTAALFNGRGELTATYDKHILMPFGEYLPGEEFFPFLRKLVPQVPDYGRGTHQNPFLVGDVRIGPSICYDALFPAHFRKLTGNGANFFVNLTGDYWFGITTEPMLHNLASAQRAVEFRRPMIRVADSGVSTAVAADGTILAYSPVWEPWQKTMTLDFVKNPPRTIFDRFGAWWPALLAAFIGIFLWQSRRRISDVKGEQMPERKQDAA